MSEWVNESNERMSECEIIFVNKLICEIIKICVICVKKTVNESIWRFDNLKMIQFGDGVMEWMRVMREWENVKLFLWISWSAKSLISAWSAWKKQLMSQFENETIWGWSEWENERILCIDSHIFLGVHEFCISKMAVYRVNYFIRSIKCFLWNFKINGQLSYCFFW